MSDTGTAKLFMHGRSQAVRLPKEFRMPGKEVRVRRDGRNVVLEPMARSPEEIQALLDELQRLADKHGDFMPGGREQPPMPSDDDIDAFDDDLS